jgi:hypothetical protein
MSIATATVDQLYNAKGKARSAELALEAYALVENPGTVAAADAAGGAAIAALAAAGISGSGTVVAVTSGVKVTATVTGSGTTGVTFTISNGIVTGIVLS